jgi:hypothetical protein
LQEKLAGLPVSLLFFDRFCCRSPAGCAGQSGPTYREVCNQPAGSPLPALFFPFPEPVDLIIAVRID